MDWPSNTAMWSLAALAASIEIVADATNGVFARTPIGYYKIGDEIDELVAKGWVILRGADGYEVTEKALYWLDRWMKTFHRKKKVM